MSGLLGLLGVRREEIRIVSLLFLYQFATGMGYTAAGAVTGSLLISALGVGALPFLVMLYAAIAVALSAVYATAAGRTDAAALYRKIYLVAVPAAIGGQCLVSSGWTVLQVPIGALALAVAFNALLPIERSHFNAFLGDLLDSIQTQRLYPLIGAGGLLGATVAGVALPRLIGAVGTERAAMVWIPLLILSALLLEVLPRAGTGAPRARGRRTVGPVAPPSFVESALAGVAAFRRNRFLHLMGAALALQQILFFIAFYQWNDQAVRAFPRPDDLAAFFANFNAAASVLGLALQVLASGRVLAALGVAGANFLFPVVTAFLFGVLLVSYDLTWTTLAMFNQQVLFLVIHVPASSMLWNAVPKNERGPALGFVNGIVGQLSMFAAGLLLLLMRVLEDPFYFSIVGFYASVFLVVVARYQKKHYIAGLLSSLAAGSAREREDGADALSDGERERLLAALSGARDPILPYLARRARAHPDAALAPRILERLPWIRGPVRRRFAAEILAVGRDPACLPHLPALSVESTPGVRAAALLAVPDPPPLEALSWMAARLEDESVWVRAHAAGILCRSGNLGVLSRALATLDALLTSSVPRDRVAGVRGAELARDPRFLSALPVVAERASAGFRAHVSRAAVALSAGSGVAGVGVVAGLISDASRRVRRDGIEGATRLGSPELAAPLVARLREADPAEQTAIVTALSGIRRLAPRAFDPTASIVDPSESISVRVGMVRVLYESDPFGFPAAHRPLLDAVLDELASTADLGAPFQGAGGGPLSFLDVAFAENLRGLCDLALTLVGTGPDSSLLDSVRRSLASGDRGAVALAIEAIRNVSDRDVGRRLAPFLDGRPWSEAALAVGAAARGRTPRSRDESLAAAFGHPAPWIRLGALHAVARGAAPALREKALSGCSFEDPLFAAEARAIRAEILGGDSGA